MAKIVIADDEADILHLLTFLLRKHTLYQATRGDQALQLVREVMPDLTILDVMMPAMTGIEVMQHLTEDPATASIPVMLLSAKGQATEVAEGSRSGARLYMVKPFNHKQLLEAINGLLDERIKSG